MKTELALLFCLLLASAWAKPQSEEVEIEDSSVRGGYDNEAVPDPCAQKHCGIGHECDLDENGEAVCICARKCNPETEERAKVCSTQNVTFDSECEFSRQKCLCRHRSAECVRHRYSKARLDYFGPCKEISECTETEMQEYPERMREWFFQVMEELARREDLPLAARKMINEAEGSSKRWVLPVIWRFCDLDTTHDSVVDHDELLPISAPLKPLEHCTGPFLERCDSDGSEDISLAEWGTCLGLDADEIEDRCDALRE